MAFEKILGQDQAKHIIAKALQSQRIAHAYLFYGPESIGKKQTALEFAKALNCTEPGPPDACDRCPSCKKIDQGIHPDVFQLESTRTTSTAREATIKIEAIRDLQGKLGYLPYEGRTKVAIVNDADKMLLQASNAFLKTLEEPPSSTVLILITSNIRKLLPTLISRCQTIRFNALPLQALRKILENQPELEIPPEELELRIIRSQGQVARALEEELIEAAQYRQELIALVDHVAFDCVDLVFTWCKKVSRDSARVSVVLEELMGLLRDLAFVHNGCSREHLLNRDIEPELIQLAEKRSPAALMKMMEAVQRTQQALSGNANIQLSLENMLMEFCEAA